MPTNAETFVVVGSGLCGTKAAFALRRAGFDGRVVLVGEEDVAPYDRPPLSKAYLAGRSGARLALHRDEAFELAGIELRLSSRAVVLDIGGRALELESGERLRWDALLLAAGARPRRLEVPGAGLAGVHYLRGVHDADRLRGALGPGRHLVVVGAGWIGCEVAATARSLGTEVDLVEVASQPLERVLGPEVGAVIADLHRQHGVRLHLGVGLAEVRGAAQVEEVVLSDGARLEAGAVLVAVGVTPRTELAESAGLAVEDGIVVDEYLATSAPGVWAAGDVASAWHPRYGCRVRLEHWSAAAQQGPAAARNMLEGAEAFERRPYFWSDQYQMTLEYSGWAPVWDEVVVRPGPGLHALWLREGRAVAGLSAGTEAGHAEVEEALGDDTGVPSQSHHRTPTKGA